MVRNYTLYKSILYLIVLFVLSDCSTVTGLKPIYPKAIKGSFGGDFFEVDSLQPTFRWESFPRPQDLRDDENGLLGQIQNVTYDLKIWRFLDRFPEKAIYSRERLPEPVHRIEKPLEPSTLYEWSVRARFEVDGVTSVTEWAGIWRDRTAQRSSVVPNYPIYYRFKTPSE